MTWCLNLCGPCSTKKCDSAVSVDPELGDRMGGRNPSLLTLVENGVEKKGQTEKMNHECEMRSPCHIGQMHDSERKIFGFGGGRWDGAFILQTCLPFCHLGLAITLHLVERTQIMIGLGLVVVAVCIILM